MSYKYEASSGYIYYFKSRTLGHQDYSRLHREDGPAVETPDGHQEWWIDGEEMTKEQFEIYMMKKAMEAWL